MKRTTLLLLLSIASTCLLWSQDASAIVKFDAELIHLGTVEKGQKVKNSFVFQNIGSEDVVIDIVSTCECTEAKWTQGPIKPGASGTINFIFDSSLKEDVVPIDVDVYFLNVDPESGNPYSTFLQYTYEFAK